MLFMLQWFDCDNFCGLQVAGRPGYASPWWLQLHGLRRLGRLRVPAAASAWLASEVSLHINDTVFLVCVEGMKAACIDYFC
jgi:hypothetical protein